MNDSNTLCTSYSSCESEDFIEPHVIRKLLCDAPIARVIYTTDPLVRFKEKNSTRDVSYRDVKYSTSVTMKFVR